MKPPSGWKLPLGKTLKLNAALNGLKQSSYIWYARVDGFMLKSGFTRMVAEPCVYFKWGEGINLSIVGLYVDDCRLQCDRAEDMMTFRDAWHREFPSTNSEEDVFLGVKKEHQKQTILEGKKISGKLVTSGEKYIDKTLVRFHMQDCNPCSTPSLEGLKLVSLDTSDTPPSGFPYEELCGCLGWIAATSHPEVKFAVNQVKKFVRNPSDVQYMCAPPRESSAILKGAKQPCALTTREISVAVFSLPCMQTLILLARPHPMLEPRLPHHALSFMHLG